MADEARRFRYRAIADDLGRELAAGTHPAGERFASEHELARRLRVSRVTVRAAIDLLVADGLLERRAGRGLYVRRRAAGGHRARVVVGNAAWAPCRQLVEAIAAAAPAAGFAVDVVDAAGDTAADVAAVRALPDGDADGAIVMALHAPAFAEALFAVHQRRFPVVVVDQRLVDFELPSVTSDNQAGGLAVGRLLVGLGHRRIGFFGDLGAGTVRDRLAGLRDAVGDAGLPFDRSLVVDIDPVDRLAEWSTAVAQAARGLLLRPDPPTAVFASCDAVARDLYGEIRALRWRVPHDVSVVGFDDDPLAAGLDPGLTTVRQDFARIGESALRLLAERIADPDAAIRHRRIDVELVRRASVAAPGRAGGG